MLESIRTMVTNNSVPFVTPKWSMYLAQMEPIWKQRTAGIDKINDISTTGCELFKNMVNLIDARGMTPTMLDAEKHMRFINYSQQAMEALIDPLRSSNVFRHHIINNRSTNEIFIPVRSDALRLPFGKPWSQWQHLRPVRMWYTDSEELTMDVITGRISYTTDQPKVVVYTVDVLMLANMWYKYKDREDDHTGIEKQTIRTFGRFYIQYIIKPMIKDIVDIWLMDKLRYVVGIQVPNDIYSLSERSNRGSARYGEYGSMYQAMITEAYSIFHRVDNNVLTPVQVLKSFRMMSTPTLYDRLQLIYDELDIQDGTQYNSLRIVRDMEIMDIILTLYELQPKLAPYSNMVIKLDRITAQRYKQTTVWTNLKDATLRDYVEKKVNDFTRRCALENRLK